MEQVKSVVGHAAWTVKTMEVALKTVEKRMLAGGWDFEGPRRMVKHTTFSTFKQEHCRVGASLITRKLGTKSNRDVRTYEPTLHQKFLWEDNWIPRLGYNN